MKRVTLEFYNLQSHQSTKFELRPGLNFILADDNNVGKSTIFKVIMCAMRLPKVDSNELNEILRGGANSGCATFSFDDYVARMWIFHDNGRAPHAFFETTYPDGQKLRSEGAPKELVEALDIVTDKSGNLLNFNDADSVQLIVQDTPKNDEVLSQVLIDDRVENIKQNISRLVPELQGDYTVSAARLEDDKRVLSSINFVETVPLFKDEFAMLEAGSRVADVFESANFDIPERQIGRVIGELDAMRSALNAYTVLEPLKFTPSKLADMLSTEQIDSMKSHIKVLEALQECKIADTKILDTVKPASLSNASRAIEVLQQLTKADSAMHFADAQDKTMKSSWKEMHGVYEELSKIAPKVNCPVKGVVFYGEEECVPAGDRLALRHGEG